MFMVYSFEAVSVSDLNPLYYSDELVRRNPYLADSLLIGEGGRRTISKVTPSFVHNTVDNPIFPTSGYKLYLGLENAGLIGGDYQYNKLVFDADYCKDCAAPPFQRWEVVTKQ